jgi:D-3-phosphoglycerate dehydrogenase
MEKIKTVCTGTITPDFMDKLNEICEIRTGGYIVTGLNTMDEDHLVELIADAEIAIIEYETVTRDVIDRCPNLKLIVCPRGKPVNIDVEAAAAKGIPVINTPGRNANSVAELVVSQMISVCRQTATANMEIKNGRFLGDEVKDVYAPTERDDVVWMLDAEVSPFKTYRGPEISYRTMGLIGFGAIGARVKKLLSGFDMNFLVFDPYLPKKNAQEHGVKLCSLEEVLRNSDFISLHCAVTPQTTGMIGAEHFAMMKPTAYFINTARGKIVRQRDLVEALQNGVIAGAVLDVFWSEPLPKNHPLLQMRNVLITPHIAGASTDVPACHSRMVYNDILHYINREPMEHVYNQRLLSICE